ncbi:MAG TPA: UDP-N-acetylmuramate dehydrogenase [Paludibacter sp.]|nr:UDP-N-acetylmuramate dehydrogenase [Paludibacter sp.]
MTLITDASLLPYNTFGIDVKADYLIEYHSLEELKEVLISDVLKSNRMLHIGGGSNLLFLSDFKGVVLHSKIRSLQIVQEDSQSVYLEVGSGVVWDDLVSYAVAKGWGGLENLSLIPGETGASAVQNIGAYGVEVQDLITVVHALEIESLKPRAFTEDECCYAYRDSIFKNELKGRFIITSVVFKLDKNPVFRLGYQYLEEAVRKNGDITLENIRDTVISIRESKLPDPKIIGNAGSFFMNPIIPIGLFQNLAQEYPEMPHYMVSEAAVKVPAGWLIEKCGWKGRRIGNTGVHDKQALVLVNYGGATGREIAGLAASVQLSVKETFGILLKPEVNFI